MTAMNTANPTPDTLRHARFGLSRMRRMAIIVAASFGLRARALARLAITHVPTTFTIVNPTKNAPNTSTNTAFSPKPANIETLFSSM